MSNMKSTKQAGIEELLRLVKSKFQYVGDKLHTPMEVIHGTDPMPGSNRFYMLPAHMDARVHTPKSLPVPTPTQPGPVTLYPQHSPSPTPTPAGGFPQTPPAPTMKPDPTRMQKLKDSLTGPMAKTIGAASAAGLASKYVGQGIAHYANPVTPAAAPDAAATTSPGDWDGKDYGLLALAAGVPLAGLLAYNLIQRKKRLKNPEEHLDDMSSVGPEASGQL